MTLRIPNEVQEQVFDVAGAMEVLEFALMEEARGNAANRNKSIFHVPQPDPEFWYNYVSMEGAIRELHVAAIRIRSDVQDRRKEVLPGSLPRYDTKFAGEPGKYCGLVLLFSTLTGELLAILPDGYIQHVRVGATSALSAKYLARPDSRTLGIMGSGGMARSHAMAVCQVRPINKIKVYSLTPANRKAFAKEMTGRLDMEVEAVDRPEDIFCGTDIVVSCTNHFATTNEPPIKGAWLEPGQHVTTVNDSESDDALFRRIDYYAKYTTGPADHFHTSRIPPLVASGSTRENYREKKVDPDKIVWLPDLMIGKCRGRQSDEQVTYFASEGTGIQFAATALRIYEAAKTRGLGHEMPTDWFLQTIKD